jgi:hypothetical protein
MSVSLYQRDVCVPRVKQADSTTSTGTTVPRNPRSDIRKLEEWNSFDSDISEAIGDLKDIDLSALIKSQINSVDEPEHCSSELSVLLNHLQPFLLGPLKRICKKAGILCTFGPSGGNDLVIGHPDLVYMDAASKESNISNKAKMIVEVKTPWAFPEVDLIDKYHQETSEQVRGSKVSRVIHQLYGYMSLNNTKFGVITTSDSNWFFRRVESDEGGLLQVSRNVACDDVQPFTIFHAYVGMICLVRKCWIHVSPFSSPTTTPKLRRPYTQIDKYSLYSLNSSELFLDRRLESSLPKGRIGCALKGRLGSADNVVFKTCDIVKDHEKALELEKEVAIYQTLESLQGVAIPRFIQYVSMWGLLSAIVLENGGVQPKVEELNKYRDQLVYKLNLIHSLGILHNDIKVANIVVKDGQALFIDFSNSIVGADAQLFEQEKRELLLLLQ